MPPRPHKDDPCPERDLGLQHAPHGDVPECVFCGQECDSDPKNARPRVTFTPEQRRKIQYLAWLRANGRV